MSFSIAIVKNGNETYLMLGDWASKEEAQKRIGDPGSADTVLAVEQYEGDENSQNREVLEALALCATYDHSIGRDLERLVQFAFDLGRKFER